MHLKTLWWQLKAYIVNVILFLRTKPMLFNSLYFSHQTIRYIISITVFKFLSLIQASWKCSYSSFELEHCRDISINWLCKLSFSCLNKTCSKRYKLYKSKYWIMPETSRLYLACNMLLEKLTQTLSVNLKPKLLRFFEH